MQGAKFMPNRNARVLCCIRNALLVCCLLVEGLLAAGIAGCGRWKRDRLVPCPPGSCCLAVGQPAPEIVGEDLTGVAFKLSDYRGKVVVLDFWGHW